MAEPEKKPDLPAKLPVSSSPASPAPATPPVLTAAGAPKPAAAAPAPAAKAATAGEEMDRRTLLQLGPVAIPWVGLAWAGFTGAMALQLGALGRFMFPNVLFE